MRALKTLSDHTPFIPKNVIGVRTDTGQVSNVIEKHFGSTEKPSKLSREEHSSKAEKFSLVFAKQDNRPGTRKIDGHD